MSLAIWKCGIHKTHESQRRAILDTEHKGKNKGTEDVSSALVTNVMRTGVSLSIKMHKVGEREGGDALISMWMMGMEKAGISDYTEGTRALENKTLSGEGNPRTGVFQLQRW